MNKEKEIEEMANLIAIACPDLIDENCGGTSCVSCLTKKLYNAGYGNVTQAVQEFAEKVKPLIDELVELLFNDNESTCLVEDCEKSDDIPCGCSICIEENKQVWKKKLDNLITELYGEDE